MLDMNSQDSEMSDETESPDTSQSIRALIESKNLKEEFTEDQLTELSQQCKQGFEADLRSRKNWEREMEEWTDLALQIREEKSYPWRGAANVKYPLLSTAAMQFNARAYPSLVPSAGDVVKAQVIGKDPDGKKRDRAERVSKYMSYQILHQMYGWEEDMDKLLMILPIVGVCFKKTYFNTVTKQNVSEIILPQNLVVNYWAKNIADAERVSEIIYMSRRVFKSRQMADIFDDEVELGDPQATYPEMPDADTMVDETTPYTLIEQHCYFDKDGDGYAEPYIVTFERFSGTIVRIVARFTDEDISIEEEDGELQEIRATQYYTKFGFVPNPDGSFYDIGFGSLLGPLNESVNTLINQLLDAGHLSTLQAGFLGKGLKLKMGEQQFKPGEWKTIASTADDLRKQILPLPVKDPSNVLFQLMGTLITSGKELASVAEIFVGKMPGQNTPATTTMATIEQGMKVFTAIYKRIYRSLSEEFNKIFDLNRTYANPNEYQQVIDSEIGPDDFNRDLYDICPGADPTAMSQTEKLMKAQGLLELLPVGILDPVKVIGRVLEAQEQPNWQELFNAQIQQTGQMPPPPPDPKMQEMQMKGQLEQQKMAMQNQATQQKMELEARDKQVQLAMKAQEHQMDMQHKAEMNQMTAAEKLHMQRIFSAQTQADQIQKMIQSDQTHKQKLQQMKETEKSQPSKSSQTGARKK